MTYVTQPTANLETTMITKGQRVTIKPEWMDKGEERLEWHAVEDEDGGRVRIECVNTGMLINPSQVVKTEWLNS